MIGAGDLDQRITLRREVRTPDGYGGWTDDVWSDVATVWAKVSPISAGEQLRSGGLQGTAMYRVTIRNRDDLDAGMQIIWRDQQLNVRQIAEPTGGGRSVFREIVAETGVAQ